MNVLSYGAGRQTAGILALIKLERLEKPDIVIFADTQGEKPETYEHIESYAKPLCAELGIPFTIVSAGSLYDYSWKYRWLPQPWQRMCSRRFKAAIIARTVRPYKPVRMWIGISVEESSRRRTPSQRWMEHSYPLVEHRLTLTDCIRAIQEVGAPIPPKSSCFFCPFQRQTQWMELKRLHLDLFQKAIDLEEHAREKNRFVTLNGRQPLKTYLEGEQLAWEDLLGAEAGCHSGYCFV